MGNSKKDDNKPGAVALKNVKMGLPQVLEKAEELLQSKGLEAVLEFAGRCTPSKGDVKLGQARVLLHLASKIQLQDPSRALSFLERVFELSPDFMEARAMACSLYDRSGQAKKGRDAALFIIDSLLASPAQVLVACDYLVRFPPDSNKALDSAKKAFDTLQRPLRWASLVLEIALKTADWPTVRELTEQLRQAHEDGQDKVADEKPRTHVLWCADEAYNIKVLKNWSQRQLALPKDTPGPIDIEPLAGRRLRVGYLSSDYREHPTSRLINGLFRHHDRKALELFMYCSGWDDKSEMRREIESHFDHIHSVQGMTDQAAAQMMRQHRLDILVELNGPTRAHRMGILAYRPAPVQIDYLGWPGTVGGRVVDYVVGDAYTVPKGAEKAYPEKIIRLDATYQVNDYAAQPALEPCSRQSQGLPEGIPVLGMFNAINKVRADVWEVWMRIMREVPDAILWMLDPGKHGRDNIARFTKAHGVAPKRIYIGHPKKQREHLSRMQCADLMLDPWPYGGHTSTSDALFAGVPVIALEGTNFAGRVSGGLLSAAGLGALVQPNVDAYVKTAVMLLRNPAELSRLKAHIEQNVKSANVFDARGKARQFEAAYRIALERAAKGLKPIHLKMEVAPLEQPRSAIVQPIQEPMSSLTKPSTSTKATVQISDRELKIPKIIHQTYANHQYPVEIKNNISSIKDLNKDWEYRFYTDSDIYEFIKKYYSPDILSCWQSINPVYGAARADLFRYLLLYECGGVYLDLKGVMTRPLSEVIGPEDTYILSHWVDGANELLAGWGFHQELLEFPRGEYQQWYLMAAPKHPFLKAVINRVIRNIKNYIPETDGIGKHGVLKLTGPIAYTLAIPPLLTSFPYRLVDAEKDMGLKYSLYGHKGRRAHEDEFNKSHYSKQNQPIIIK